MERNGIIEIYKQRQKERKKEKKMEKFKAIGCQGH